MARRQTEEEARAWLAVSLPQLELIEWGGSASTSSLFKNVITGDTWSVPLKRLRKRLACGPVTTIGFNNKKTEEQIRETLKELDTTVVLQEWGGSAGAKSVFRDLSSGTTFTRTAAEVVRELKEAPGRKFGVGRGGNNRRTSLPQQQALLNRYTERFKILQLDPTSRSQFKDRHTGEVFSYYHTSLLSSLAKNSDFVPGSTVSSLERVGRALFPENHHLVFNRKLEGSSYIPDILCPAANLIVECDGLYYHGEPFRSRDYHAKKKAEYTAQGFRSFFFREDELLCKQAVCESMVKNALGQSTRIGARKCTVATINPEFFVQNHLMGKGSGLCFGLTYLGEVVAGMQVRWINKSAGSLDISRFCTRLGTSVVGGFSRLLAHAERLYRPRSVRSFVDLRYGTGQHLESLGFICESVYPSFKWTDLTHTYHRMKYPGNSGYARGLTKIWDCGQAKWTKYAA